MKKINEQALFQRYYVELKGIHKKTGDKAHLLFFVDEAVDAAHAVEIVKKEFDLSGVDIQGAAAEKPTHNRLSLFLGGTHVAIPKL